MGAVQGVLTTHLTGIILLLPGHPPFLLTESRGTLYEIVSELAKVCSTVSSCTEPRELGKGKWSF